MEEGPASAAPRVVVDTGVYVSAAISGRGPTRAMLDAALSGRLTLVASPRLLGELADVLARPKFRRWLTSEESAGFLAGVELLVTMENDPSLEGRQPVCRDPDDEYLIALAESAECLYLVSGDQDLLVVERGGLSIRTPRELLDELDFEHPWGSSLVPGTDAESWLQARAEGHEQVLRLTHIFLDVVARPDAVNLLPAVVTPESLGSWFAQLDVVRTEVAGRGVASRPEYPMPDLAYVKLPRDPGQVVRATADVLLPGAIILTAQRRGGLTDHLHVGGWRVHAVGDYWRPDGQGIDKPKGERG